MTDHPRELMPDGDRQSDALSRLMARVQTQPAGQSPLSPMQTLTLQAYASGLRRPEIAQVLGVADDTVREHTERARRALQAKTVAQAVAVAYRRGLIL